MTHVQHDIARLEASGLIRLATALPELEYLFRHALVQDAAYATLVKSERQALHQVAGETLERLFADRLAELAPQLGHHFYEAGDDSRALKYLAAAGESAAAAYANAEAVQHYRRAIEIARHFVESQPGSPEAHAASTRHADTPRYLAHSPHPPPSEVTATLRNLVLKCGRVLELMNRYPDALALYQKTAAFAQQVADPKLELAAVLAQTTAYLAVGSTLDPARAQALIEDAFRLAHTLDDQAAEAEIGWRQMMLLMVSGQPRESIAHGERALALARELGLRELVAYLLDDLSRVYLINRQSVQGLKAVEEAELLWRELGNLPLLADSLGMAASIHLLMGHFDEALRLGQEALQIAHSSDNAWGKAMGGQAGFVLFERGEAGQGLAQMEAGLRLSESGEFGYGMMILAAHLALAYEALGAYNLGLEYARRSVANAEKAAPFARRWVLPVEARLLLANGRLAEAQELADAAGPRSDMGQLERNARQTDCLLALARGNYDQALAEADEAIAIARLQGYQLELVEDLTLRGQVLLALDRRVEGHAAYAEARAIAEAIGSKRSMWPALAALARLEADAGNHTEAYALRRQARSVIEYIADHIAAPDVRASLFNLPDAREVMGASEVQQ